MNMMAARVKDLRQKLIQSSPSSSPSRNDNGTLYSDNVTGRGALPSQAKADKSASTEVIVVSDSNEDNRHQAEVIQLLSESEAEEEDVTTTIMKFNKSQQNSKPKDKHIKQKRHSKAPSDTDDDVRIVSGTTSTADQHSGKTSPRKSKKKLKHKKKKQKDNEKEEGAISSSDDEARKPVAKKRSNGNRKAAQSSDDHHSPVGSGVENVGETDNYAYSDSFGEYDGEEAEMVRSGIKQFEFFSPQDCQILEQMIDDEVVAKIDTFKNCTVDRAPLRNKYFFGEGYTYGDQMKRKGPGMEELYPKGFVDGIPEWVTEFVIKPLEKAKVIPQDYVNSCVINDYLSGGCITSHIDPKQLFDRPIYTLSLMSDSALSFGVRFSFRPIRCSEPVYRVPLKRGCLTAIRLVNLFYRAFKT